VIHDQVKLSTRRLAELMAHREMTAALLADRCGGTPTKRSINRWLKQSREKADDLASTSRKNAKAMAYALDTPLKTLIDSTSVEGAFEGLIHTMAAAAGPVVYPELLRTLAGRNIESILEDPAWFTSEFPGPPVRRRFARWSLWTDLIRGGATLTTNRAERALNWAAERGLDASSAPELVFMCSSYLDQRDSAREAGLNWLKGARRQGNMAQARWIGERVLKSGLVSDDPAAYAHVAQETATGQLFCGEPEVAFALLANTKLLYSGQLDPVQRADLELCIARVRKARGDVRDAIAAADRAIRLLGASQLDGAAALTARAYMDKAHYAEILGEQGMADEANRHLTAMERDLDEARLPRRMRLRGNRALENATPREACRLYHAARETARATGNGREFGLNTFNLAIACSLVGESEEATQLFMLAEDWASAEAGDAVLHALILANHAQHQLCVGAYRLALEKAIFSRSEFTRAGRYPGLAGYAARLHAEAALHLGDAAAFGIAREAYRYATEADGAQRLTMAFAICSASSDANDPALRFAGEARGYLATFHGSLSARHRVDCERLVGLGVLLRTGDDGALLLARAEAEAGGFRGLSSAIDQSIAWISSNKHKDLKV
jgi:transcriptional regulator with XRE-family HTH domain